MLRPILLLAALLLPAAAPADDGRQMYGKKCLACHALDGSGDKPLGKKMGVPDLRATKLTQAEIERVISEGRGKMLPYKEKITPEQIAAIAAHVREGFPQPPPAAPPAPPAATPPQKP
jgi:mono/diheme cytochrome c family protein